MLSGCLSVVRSLGQPGGHAGSSQGWPVGAGCGQEASGPLRMDLSSERAIRSTARLTLGVFYTLVSEVTLQPSPAQYSASHRSAPGCATGNRSRKIRSGVSPGAMWGLATIDAITGRQGHGGR